MAYEIIRTKSIKATASLATAQFTFVKIDTNGQIAAPSNGGTTAGVLQDKPAAGDPGAVCFPGDITKIQGGGSFNAGDLLQTDGNGKAVKCVTGSYIQGIALTAGTSTTLADMIYQPLGKLS